MVQSNDSVYTTADSFLGVVLGLNNNENLVTNTFLINVSVLLIAALCIEKPARNGDGHPDEITITRQECYASILACLPIAILFPFPLSSASTSHSLLSAFLSAAHQVGLSKESFL